MRLAKELRAQDPRIVRFSISSEEPRSTRRQRRSFDRYIIDFGRSCLFRRESSSRWLSSRGSQTCAGSPSPGRTRSIEIGKKRWWQFAETSPEYVQGNRPAKSRCLVTARDHKHMCLLVSAHRSCFQQKSVVFALDSHTQPFAILQSRIHEPWAQRLVFHNAERGTPLFC